MRLLLAILLLLVAAPAQAQQGQGMSKALVVSSCGGGALPSGALNQLTMDTTGRLCQSGIGSNVCSQATAYLARATGETAHAADLTTLICGLVTDGVWSKLDALYVLAQQTQADARLNLLSTSYPLTPVGAPVFSGYQGFNGFTSAIYFDTGFNPTTAVSPQFVRNSGNIGAWSYAATNDVGGGSQIGNDISNNAIASNWAGVFYVRVSGPGGGMPTPGTKGLFAGDRSGSANFNYYGNGASLNSEATASVAPTNANFFIGQTSTYATAQTISAAHIGASLGATLNLALYNRLRTYMSAVGVP